MSEARTVAWRWKQKGRTDVHAWHYQVGHPQLPADQYDTEPVVRAAELDQLKRERDDLIDVLRRHGFRRCDIAACNCNSWHHVEGYAARFREFDDALNEAGFSTNGRVALDALKEALALAVSPPHPSGKDS